MTAFEVVVVDNGSNDGSYPETTLPDARFRWLAAGRNLGFAAGTNLGAHGCQAPWIATLNPDTVADPNWLEALKRATEHYPDIAVFGSTQIDAMNPERLDGCGDVCSGYGIPWRGGYGLPISQLPGDGETFAPCAAAALYRRDVFEAVGGFDESFFCYLEDVDLGYRLRLAGGRCMQVAAARVGHIGSAIGGRTSTFTLYHSYRNRVWLVFNNTPFPLLLIVLPLHVLTTLGLLVMTRRLPEGGTCIRGLWAGLAGLPGRIGRRREVQKLRRISNFRVVRALTWSLVKLRARAVDLRER